MRGNTFRNKFCLSQLTRARGIVKVHYQALVYQNGEGGFGDYISTETYQQADEQGAAPDRLQLHSLRFARKLTSFIPLPAAGELVVLSLRAAWSCVIIKTQGNNMKKMLLVAVAFVIVFASAGVVQTLAKDTKKTSIQSKQLVGNWYMGTMSGFDCNLKISSINTLSVQFGGCFHQDPLIETQWKLQGDRIKFQNASLNKSLGSSLRVAKYKGHFVLLPERPQANRGTHEYSYYHCFWRNTMKNGLQLSKDAPT